MRTRILGVTDLHLTVVGLGTAGIVGGQTYAWAPSDDAEGTATIHQGLTWASTGWIRRPSQIAQAASGGDWVLSAEEIAEIDALLGQLPTPKEG